MHAFNRTTKWQNITCLLYIMIGKRPCYGTSSIWDGGIFCGVWWLVPVDHHLVYIYKPMYWRPYPPLYSRLLLSQLRLSRITAYIEVKIWSLFEHENLTSAVTKNCGKRGEIAPKGQFLLFSTIFSIISGVKLHIHLWNVVVRFTFSLILQIWYVEVQITRGISESHFDFKITSVDCIK